MDQILQAIGTYGFPIVMCIGLCFAFYKLISKILADQKEFNLSLLNKLESMLTEMQEIKMDVKELFRFLGE